MKTNERIDTFSQGFTDGWNKGWEAHESYVEQKILDGDPGFQAWLDKLERLARVNRERDELALQQQHAAVQALDDEQTN